MHFQNSKCKQIMPFTLAIMGNEMILPTGFLPFGSAFGDSRVPTSDDGSTREIRLGTDIVIFGSRQNRLYVSHTFLPV